MLGKFMRVKRTYRYVLISHLMRQGFFYPPFRLWARYAGDDRILRECLQSKN